MFYLALGFDEIGGDVSQRWVILRNGGCTLGLFEGHIPSNTLTFNPGWTQENQPVERFTDLRDIQAWLEAAGETVTQPAQAGSGPAFFTCKDPDGNVILVDQHVNAPKAVADV